MAERVRIAWQQNPGLVSGPTIVVGLMLIFFVLRWQGLLLLQQVQIFDILLKMATIAAITVGAVWSYNAFIRQRLGAARLKVKQVIEPVRLPDGRHLLKVYVTVENIGQIQVQLERWELRAEQILPLTEAIEKDYLPKLVFTDVDALWSYYEQGIFLKPSFGMMLEPGEDDQAVGNLVIPEDAEVIQVYSHLHVREDGVMAKGVPRGWPCQSIIDLRKGKKKEAGANGQQEDT